MNKLWPTFAIDEHPVNRRFLIWKLDAVSKEAAIFVCMKIAPPHPYVVDVPLSVLQF
jgi:hypothetical protein